MSKKIILADGSYTIRRIVELSFEGEDDFELISIDNGAELKEKLGEISPHVVIVDVNLPDVSGYEICEYINGNDELKNIRVILLKGSFEPIDENRIAKLKYDEIIQKPFESNSFIETVKKIANNVNAVEPPSMPEEEDISNIGFGEEEDISFSDVKEELEKDEVGIDVNPDEISEDVNNEVMPSEEITQGSLSEHEDKLIDEQKEEKFNPFSENKKDITLDGEEKEEESFKTVYKEENINEQNIENPLSEVQQEQEPEISISKEEEEQKKEIKIDLDGDSVEEEAYKKGVSEFAEDNDLSEEDTKQEIGKKDLLMDTQDEETFEKMDFNIPEKQETEEEINSEDVPDKMEEFSNLGNMDEEKEKFVEDTNAALEDVKKVSVSDLVEEDFSEAISETTDSEGIEAEEKDESFISDDVSEDIDKTFGVEEKKVIEEAGESVDTEKTITDFGDQISKEEILNRIESKLVDVVKEILWEVLPPIAERIIKEEIERIREELSKLQ